MGLHKYSKKTGRVYWSGVEKEGKKELPTTTPELGRALNLAC